MPEAARQFFHEAWAVAGALAPWLFLGLGIAGLLHVLLPPDFIRRHLGRPGWGGVVKAAAFGVPLPLCSCGVVPAAMGLKRDGASDGASVAFLISTPQTGVDSVTVSAAFLGWPFAMFKVVAALVTGVFGGLLTDAVHKGLPGAQPAPADSRAASGGGVKDRLREFWHFTAGELLGGIWRWLLAGVLVSALVGVLFPKDALANAAWAHGFTGMLVMLLIALPMYVCATASVPIAAALVHAGLPPGAALVFLMAGPASNAATIGAVWRTFGPRVTAVYLGVIAVASLGLGQAFNFLVVKIPAAPAAAGPCCENGGMAAGHVWAALLAAAFLAYAVRDVRRALGPRKKPCCCCEKR